MRSDTWWTGLTRERPKTYRGMVRPGQKATLGLSCFSQFSATALYLICAAPWAAMSLACASGEKSHGWLGDDKDQTTTTSTQEGPSTLTTASTGSSADPGASTGGASQATTSNPAVDTQNSTSTSMSTSIDPAQASSGETAGSDAGTGSEEPLPKGQGFACGVKITRVSINQGLEIPLSEGPTLLPIDGPRKQLWSTRPSFFRVYIEKRTPGPKEITVVLDVMNVANGLPLPLVLRERVTLNGSSTEADIKSTVNFVVPPDLISSQSRFRVRVKQADRCEPGPQDRSMVPRHGSWGLTAPRAPRLDLQFIRVRFSDEPAIARFRRKFKNELRKALRARYPFSMIRFNLWEPQTIVLPGSASTTKNPAQARLDAVVALRERRERARSTLHYVGLGRLGPHVAGLGSEVKKVKPSVCLVNVDGEKDRLIARIVAMVPRLHGITADDCNKSGSSGAPGTIGRWGFDAPNNKTLEPDGYFDISCGKTPDWVHLSTYTKIANHARAIEKRGKYE